MDNEGYLVVHCSTVQDANDVIAKKKFDLAILDMQLPDGSGVQVWEKLLNTSTSIIFLTVVDDENQIVQAFEKGAADYITKPFRLRELLARVKRTLSNQEGKSKTEMLCIDQVNIDTTAGKVYIRDELVDLTALEYRLLLIFASNKSTLLSRNQILEKIWDSGENFVEDNTLTVYVKRLREKLGSAIHIETVRGIGYRVD